MILTITLNPLLERRLFFKDINAGTTNRAEKEFFTAGGKGINVNRQLNLLGIRNNAITFAGGHNGKILRSILAEEKIDCSYCSMKCETRQATLAFDESSQKLTTLFGLNPVVTENESTEFKNKLDKAIQNCSIVILSGSSPSVTTDDIFPLAISLANKHDKISILDTYGRHLNNCIEQSPTVIHNNIDELQDSLGTGLNSEDAKIEMMNYLYKKGIRMTFLTNGGSPAYASKFDFHYKVAAPLIIEKDPCGSGDSFNAGIAYGLENSLVFNDFLKIAVALGTANATSFETSMVTMEQMNNYYDKIEILPIGKKMKLIDDSPTI
jgi:tagatose 6-phosphate kinase